jgi:hypothetical protein
MKHKSYSSVRQLPDSCKNLHPRKKELELIIASPQIRVYPYEMMLFTVKIDIDETLVLMDTEEGFLKVSSRHWPGNEK